MLLWSSAVCRHLCAARASRQRLSSACSLWWRQSGGDGSSEYSLNKHDAALYRATYVVFSLLFRHHHDDRGIMGGKAGLSFAPWYYASPDLSLQPRRCRPLIWRKTLGVDLEAFCALMRILTGSSLFPCLEIRYCCHVLITTHRVFSNRCCHELTRRSQIISHAWICIIQLLSTTSHKKI